jgi:hypothetical protein
VGKTCRRCGQSNREEKAADEEQETAHELSSPSALVTTADIALSNTFDVGQAFKRAIEGRSELPDFVFLVETDGAPISGWMLKDGPRILPDESHFEDAGSEDAVD